MMAHEVLTTVEAIGGMFGGLAALFWIGRRLLLLDRAIAKIGKLTTDELSHNGGHSTKDYAAKGYRKARKVEHQVQLLEQKLNAHLDAHANGQPSQVTVTTGGATPDA